MSKKLIAIAALLASGGAFAQNISDIYTLGELNIGTEYSVVDVESSPAWNTLYGVDFWDFTLPVGGTGAFGSVNPVSLQINLTPGNSVNIGSTDITGIELYALNPFAQVSGGLVSLGTATTPSTYSFSNLTGGSQYRVVLHYDVNQAGGGYYGTITAVPEPETYGMMALGLGVLGFIGRRRKQQA